MKFSDLNTDEAILQELGKRLKERRSSMGLKQEEAANQAMLSRSTVSKIENGHPTQTPEFFRYAKAVGLLELLEEILPEETISPLSLIKKEKVFIKGVVGNWGFRDQSARDALKSSTLSVNSKWKSESDKSNFVWPEDKKTVISQENEED